MTETTLRQNMSGEICCEIQGPRTISGEVHAAILDVDAEFVGRRTGARITISGCYHSPVKAWRGEVSDSGHELMGREVLGVFAQYAEPGTKGTVGWGHVGDPEKRVRAIVAPTSSKADHRLLRLRAA
ncbi:hypothetical protein M2158_005640 [Streptomyces sp. SAI-144]|uniref:hypothetical protein n=1 Tax=Streptomyces sp. SAI-144 TaxID=2940544 RepID=UPI002476884D|nr:hypothetical protein [Streptomyces sp. SAI-144]MDH6437099.1 hypothetical protein [Streptomyces sp. SAI-144]